MGLSCTRRKEGPHGRIPEESRRPTDLHRGVQSLSSVVSEARNQPAHLPRRARRLAAAFALSTLRPHHRPSQNPYRPQILFLPYSFLRNLRLKTEDFSPPTGCTPPSAAPTPATRFRQSTPTLATNLPPESPPSALHCSSSTHYQSASLPSPSPDTCARPPS